MIAREAAPHRLLAEHLKRNSHHGHGCIINDGYNPQLPAKGHSQSCSFVGSCGKEPQASGEPSRSLRHGRGLAFYMRDIPITE